MVIKVIMFVNLLKVHLFWTQMDTQTTTVIQVRITHNPLYLSVHYMTVKLCVDHVPPSGGQVLVKDSVPPIYDVAALWTLKSEKAFIVEGAPQLPDV